jgi:hypothetical protein
METNINKPAVFINVDSVLNNPDLRDEPKSIMLLHVYKLARILYPDWADSYLDQLGKISAHLPSNYQNEFNELNKSFSVAQAANPGKFKSEILKAIEEAKQKKETDPSASVKILMECITKIKKRWWSFGKGSLWLVLIPVLFDTDRQEALKSVHKLPQKIRKDQIIHWNEVTPLSTEEWNLLSNVLGFGLKDIFKEILDKDDKILNISENLMDTLGSKLIDDIHYYSSADASDEAKTAAETTRENGLNRFQSLLTLIHKEHPDQAMKLMESLGEKIMSHNIYEGEKSWVNRISDLRVLLNFWVKITDHNDKVITFLKNKTPKHLKGFTLAQWYAISTTTDEATEEAFRLLAAEPADKLTSEAWFLIILVLTGRGPLAYKLSQQSVSPAELTPRLIRQWIIYDSKDVLQHVPKEELPKDLISQFLLLPSVEDQMEFLREKTKQGNNPLPKEMWKMPDFLKLFSIMEKASFIPLDSEEHLFTTFYFKSEKKENQMFGYIKQFGFGQYSYTEIDQAIVKALNCWEIEHPEEVTRLFDKMWSGFIPDQFVIQADVLRNAVFERYRNIFAAQPESLQKHFISWIKKEFVDKSRQWTIGETTYTFSLRDVAPFIYCLQAARTIGNISPLKCDQVLTDAIKSHTSEASLMNSAASLYASDKETIPVNPPCQIKSKSLLMDWQIGVIQASLKRITNAMLKELNEKAMG